MSMLVITATAAAAATIAPTPQDQIAAMARIYDEVCLKAFPDDKAVDQIMERMQAKPLSDEEVRVTFNDDPGRAWLLDSSGATVWLELPPYHACSVRWSSPAIGDLSAYRRIADSYQRTRPGFQPMEPMQMDKGDIRIRAVGEQRVAPDGATESLYFFTQHITDPKRRDAGETGFSLRFVHQFAPANAQ